MKATQETYYCVAPLEIALLAKEKGFNLDTIHVWCDYNTIEQTKINPIPIVVRSESQRKKFSAAPTRELLMKWLRKVHDIHIEILLSGDVPFNTFEYNIFEIGQYFTLSKSDDKKSFKTYEEALDACLIRVLNEL
jgi:hypothetical protein